MTDTTPVCHYCFAPIGADGGYNRPGELRVYCCKQHATRDRAIASYPVTPAQRVALQLAGREGRAR